MQLVSREGDIAVDDTPAADDLRLMVLAQRDPRAFGPLYERYADPIYFFCYRRLNNAEDAADATSLVFTRALQALPHFQPRPSQTGSTVRAWLYTIARNVVVDTQRRRRDHRSLDQTDAQRQVPATVLTDRGPGPEDQAIAATEADRLHAVLTALSERQRAVIELRLAGLTMPEIAATLDQSVSATKSLQVRAYRLLRDLLRPDTEGEVLP